MHGRMLARAFIVLAIVLPRAHAEETAADAVTLERIMADPDWIGRSPERPYWADDGRTIYYAQKQEGNEERDLIQITLDGERLRLVADEDRGSIDQDGGTLSHDRRWKAYSRAGDLFLKNLRNGEITQLTRTSETESDPSFMIGDRRLAYRSEGTVLIRDLDTGLVRQPADLRTLDDPEEKEERTDFLREQQERLFINIQEREAERERSRTRAREQQAADRTRTPPPWYLGDDVSILQSELSPTGDWMLLRLAAKQDDAGRREAMPNYVSESGYIESRNVRSKVGTGKPRGERLVLLDLNAHEQFELDLTVLPQIDFDPLKEIREKAEAAKEKEPAGDRTVEEDAAKQPDGETSPRRPRRSEPKHRPVIMRAFTWSDDGRRLAVQCFSLDNKDRWIALVDFDAKKLVPLDHLHDDAWINARFSQMGWLKDNATLYFLSESSGYSHLYTVNVDEIASLRALTSGEYEVSGPRLSLDGKHIYYTANAVHPGITEFYRVALNDGRIEQLTNLGGQNIVELSPDERRLLITHSTTTRPPELYVQRARPGADAAQLTHTVSDEFLALAWTEPEIVAVPSRSGRPIYTRVYTPPAGPDIEGQRPAVLFIHGAGYLQDAHQGWSSYFHEFMFNTLLTRRGYVVLDADYRASAGYGRDWRAAIYRQMGAPEIEDLSDVVDWAVRHLNVDSSRIGCYGGSYGGFLTLMALFTQPDLMACGAALRPVTDWAHYNHGYTSDILNIPSIDPDAYQASSPIELAEGLSKPLLICHGMQDDNVFFQDSIRLAQRLIELKKENWELAVFPVESHGFREPTSWLDEYRRILKLFETHLK